MARERGYNYYEADAVLQLTNPFVDVSADNPTMAAFAGKPLKVRVLQTVHSGAIKYISYLWHRNRNQVGNSKT